MSAIHDLLSQVQDEALRTRMEQEIEKLSKTKKFGLVFEEHLPECTPLYDIPIKRGSIVANKNGSINDIYSVLSIKNNVASCYQKLTKEIREFGIDELVCVAQFGEPIYPYLKPIDSVCNAPNSHLWHTLIEADNYHALQLLNYLYAGKVDCIYIDPPYNTGAKDWKYNNDYVDSVDQYRHSKWLSMMKKRLIIAKNLLNPKDSTLICTIDDKEYLHLGCLLEQIFPEANIQMITSVISPGGRGKKKGTDFTNTEEFIYYVRLGNAIVYPEIRNEEVKPIDWRGLIRGTLANGRGKHGVGACGPNQFYPIYVNDSTQRIQKIGDPIPEGVSRFSVPQIEGCTAVFPVRPDGTEMNWGCVPSEAKKKLENGYLRVSSYSPNKPQQYGIQYLTSGSIKDIESGKVVIDGYRDDGSVLGHYPTGKPMLPSTVWNKPTHNATKYGTELLKSIFVASRFDYPKSLYAVRDSLSHVLKGKKNALVVDFFAGSGTTLHALNLLNAMDNGNRRCILVTNNELSNEEAELLKSKGIFPGDEEWEKLGIARYVTWPRTKCSIKGVDVNGNPLEGDYDDNQFHMSDGFKTNAAFFKLSFLDKDSVALGRHLGDLFPLLWLKAGAIGACPQTKNDGESMYIFPDNSFAILVDEKDYQLFLETMEDFPDINTIYIVTDSEVGYQDMISPFQEKNTFQLYRDYLDNFRINVRREEL